MLDLLGTLKADHAILLVEHDMDAVFRVADRITVMVNGQVIASDAPERIRADPPCGSPISAVMKNRRGHERAARHRRPARALRRQPRAARRLDGGAGRRLGRPARPQRHGQDDP
jgi:ABC-type proline/glycine betaine transport system ATPase subunit